MDEDFPVAGDQGAEGGGHRHSCYQPQCGHRTGETIYCIYAKPAKYMQNQQNICKTSKMYAKQVNKEEYFMRFLIECAVNTSDIHGLVCSIVICLELTFMLLTSPIHSDKQGSR